MFGELFHKYPEEVSGNIESENRLKPVVDVAYLESLCEGSELLENLLQEMLTYCYRYAETSIRFRQALQELDNPDKAKEIAALDEETRTVHNAAIDSINLFSRELAKAGKDNSWMEKVVGHRAYYAKFIFTLVFDEIARELENNQQTEQREAAD